MSVVRSWPGTLYLAVGRALYVGPTRDTKAHAHHAIQACFSLDEPFGLREAPSNSWMSANAAIIPTNVRHQLDGRGHQLAIFYLEPESHQGRTVVHTRASTAITMLDDNMLKFVRRAVHELAANGPQAAVAPNLFNSVFRALDLAPLDRRMLDLRVARILEQVRADPNCYGSMSKLAATVGLSPRRLRELFKSELGISGQRALLWTRLSLAIRELSEGRSVTDAAHGVGFSDAAHLTRTFQRMFGIAPSTLGGIVRVGSVAGSTDERTVLGRGEVLAADRG